MWLQSSQNLFFKISQWIFILGLTLNFQSKAFSADVAETPGIIESISQLENIHQDRFKKLRIKIETNPKVISNLDNIKKVRLNREYLLNLLFKSTTKYNALLKANDCNFYSLLAGPIFRSTAGSTNSVIVDFQKGDGAYETAIVTKKDFLDKIYQSECFNNKQIETLFNSKNIKSTIKSIPFTIPKIEKECEQIHDDWIKNPYTPYLCRLDDEIQRGSRASRILNSNSNLDLARKKTLSTLTKRTEQLKEIVPFFERSYINNLCSNLSDRKPFCKAYLAQDIWTKVVNGEREKFLMKYRCSNLLGLDKLEKIHYMSCAKKLKENPKLCTLKGRNNYPSLFPTPNCDEISQALNNSNLRTEYHDCPANIDNEGITNIHRILSHIKSRKIESDHNSCASEANFSFAQLNFEFKNKKGWPLKICYNSKVTNKEECLPYIPGAISASDIEEPKVIANILYKNYGGASNTKCQFIDDKTYNPIRLEYAIGCFIVYNASLCTPLHCSKRIIYNKKEIKGLKYIGTPVFDYFPNSYLKEGFSIVKIMEQVHKIQNRSLKNLTELKNFLKKKKTNIAHGIGCAEELLPSYFKKTFFNQCTPLPFIIDGTYEEKGNSYLVLRTAIDDIHSPRLVQWNFIFSALSSYRANQPLGLWTLYGIR